MTDVADIAKVAGAVSEAQKRWLLATEPTLERVAKVPCEEWWDNPDRLYVVVGGEDCWLGSREMCSPEGSPNFETGSEQLTPLGIAVRNHLAALSPEER